MELKFRYRFEAAHRLSLSPESSCATPHGHTWYASLHLKSKQAQLNSQSMLVEFAELKTFWKKTITETFDHSYLCHHKDPIIEALLVAHKDSRIIPFPGDPTTELISILLFHKAKLGLENSPYKDLVQVSAITIEETPTNSLTCDSSFYLETFPHYKEFNGWWNSINPNDRSLNYEALTD